MALLSSGQQLTFRLRPSIVLWIGSTVIMRSGGHLYMPPTPYHSNFRLNDSDACVNTRGTDVSCIHRFSLSSTFQVVLMDEIEPLETFVYIYTCTTTTPKVGTYCSAGHCQVVDWKMGKKSRYVEMTRLSTKRKSRERARRPLRKFRRKYNAQAEVSPLDLIRFVHFRQTYLSPLDKTGLHTHAHKSDLVVFPFNGRLFFFCCWWTSPEVSF